MPTARTSRASTLWFRCALAAFAALASCLALISTASATPAGAGFTTFVAGDEADCFDSPNGINCNGYADKESVFMSGGPSAAGLSDGSYFFAVLVPGSQNGGFVDTADGNLSDTTAGSTTGDNGSGDDVSNRTFTVSGHQIASYGGTHATGVSPNGRDIIGLAPFDDTSNPGGVYILAICETGATSPSDCKFDAFHVQSPGQPPPPPFGEVSGTKYYDANTNGQLDAGEVGIKDWPIDWTDGLSGTELTDASGNFSLSLVADTYTFAEQVAGSPWMRTGNLVDQSVVSGGATVSLLNKVYTVGVIDGSSASGLDFGNVCVGAGGGRTLGFWSNKNGSALFGSDDLAQMVSLNLRNANGSAFDPANYNGFRTWLLNATATNMAYMLSAQLAAMKLNAYNGSVDPNALIYAPGTTSANTNGFAKVSDVVAEANAELGLHGLTLSGSPSRAYQEALKNALDNANNNLTFVQSGPNRCPAPVFP